MKKLRAQHLSTSTFFKKVNVKRRNRERNTQKIQKILLTREKKVSVKWKLKCGEKPQIQGLERGREIC
jgi:hypothetical protein